MEASTPRLPSKYLSLPLQLQFHRSYKTWGIIFIGPRYPWSASAQIYIFHIYTRPKFTQTQIYTRPIFTQPRFTQTHIFRETQIYTTQIYTKSKFTQPKFTQNPKLRDNCRTRFEDTRLECGLRLPKALRACEWFKCCTRLSVLYLTRGR